MTTFMRLQSPFDRELKGLKKAIDASIIFSPGWMRRNYNFLKWTKSLPPPVQSWKADFDSVWSSPKSIHNYQQSIGVLTYPGTGAESWRVELSRFIVPLKQVGVIKAYEQFLSTTEVQTETVWSIATRWGDPRAPIGTWYFRLSPYTGLDIPWVNQLNPTVLRPGSPYNDVPDETGLWFPLGSSTSNNIHLLVPGGYVLRLFWECAATSLSPSVGARLRGYLQSSFSVESRNAIRSYW